jgi:oligopeptide transport system substrate-binding protein
MVTVFARAARIRLSLFMLMAATLTACGNDGAYFGNVTPPKAQRLVYINGQEPGPLDPGTHPGGREMPIINALFEGLTRPNPVTLEPMAGLATHYEPNIDRTRYTFYLRGHPVPRGIRLPNTDSLSEAYRSGALSEDFARGHHAPPDNVPARWSDGAVITADDFVYSWRRVVDPSTASPNASALYVIRNAEAINAGRASVDSLGVRALDRFTLQVDLASPAPFFIHYQMQRMFFPVPPHAVRDAAERGRESAWTEPGRMVSSGAFTLVEHRPYDLLVVARNPRYYEPDPIGLDQIVFLPVSDVTAVNLYKAGLAHAMDGGFFPLEFVDAVSHKRDFGTAPIDYRNDYCINTTRPPFDNVLVRYALSMATNREAITKAYRSGDTPASSYVPPVNGYAPVQALPISVGDRTYDVLAYDPPGARSLLARAGYPDGRGPDGKQLRVEITTDGAPSDEILQQQWQTNLGVEVHIAREEFQVWIQSLLALGYTGVAHGGWTGKYFDPYAFLDFFVGQGIQSGTGYHDAQFDRLIAEANAEVDNGRRMQKLAECERHLLKAMPLISISFGRWPYLRKPYVHGLVLNPLNEQYFRYAWIDTAR